MEHEKEYEGKNDEHTNLIVLFPESPILDLMNSATPTAAATTIITDATTITAITAFLLLLDDPEDSACCATADETSDLPI